MRGTERDGAAAMSELCNLRFLAARQLRVIDDLDRRGLDGQDARELLARLMRRHADLLPRALEHRPLGLNRSEREDDARVPELERFRSDQVMPPDRNAP